MRPSDEALLRESDWLRALAHQLVRDPNEAEDLGQATLLEALERPPGDGARLRGWLRTVLVNRLRQDRRAASRRRLREANHARETAEELAPDTSDVVARATTFRALAEHVLELDEPFRSAVLLRFYDDLAPRAIARRTGVPVATARSRIRRGLERLRARLDDEHGDRDAWALLLLPIGFDSPRAALVVALMNTKLKIALVVAALGAGLFGLRVGLAPEQVPVTELPSVETTTVAQSAPTTPNEATTRSEATQVVAVEPAAPEGAEPDEAQLVVARGRVLGLDGRGRSGLRVVLKSGDGERAHAISDASGRFEVEVTEEPGLFELDEEDWKAISLGAFEPRQDVEPVLVVAPAARFAGRVVDDVDRPVEGANVLLKAPADLGYRIDTVLDASQATTVRTESDANGYFVLDGWLAEHTWIQADRAGYLRTEIRAPDQERSDLELRLAPKKPARQLMGEVVDPSGRPVPAAWVSAGVPTTRADEQGRFRFTWNPPMDRLVAVAAGFRTGSFEFDSAAVPSDAQPPFARIVLPGPTGLLQGRVVDEDGKARPNVRVWIRDPTYFGEIGEDSGVAESLGAGARSDAEIEAEFAEELDRGEVDAYLAAVAATPSTFWNWVVTDAQGHFELGGLDARSYSLRAMDMQTLAVADTEPIAAETAGVEIVLPRCGGHETLTGRTVDQAGQPIAGATVFVVRHAFFIDRGELGQRAMSVSADEVTTATDGSFELACVPKEGVLCVVSKSGYRQVQAGTHDLSPADWIVELQPRAPPTLYTHVRVELEDPDFATSFELLGPDDERLSMRLRRGGQVRWRPTANFLSGVSEVLRAPAGNATLRLLKDGVEIARHAIVLLPDQVNRLHY